MAKLILVLFAALSAIAYHPASAQSALHREIIAKRAEFMAAEKAGDYRTSVEITRSLLPLVARDRGQQSAFYAQAQQDHGMALHWDGRSTEAVPFLASAYGYMRSRAPRHSNTLAIMNNYFVVLLNAEQFSKAEPIGEELLVIRETTLGGRHVETLLIKHNLASLYSDQGKPFKASGLLDAVLRIRRETAGNDDPQTLTSMHNLGVEFNKLFFFDQALNLFAEASERRGRVLGPDHPTTLSSLTGYTTSLLGTGQSEKALDILDRIIPVFERKLGPSHPTTLGALHNKGRALSALGNVEESHALLTKTTDLYRSSSAKGGSGALNSDLALAWSYQNRKESKKAYALFTAVRPKIVKIFGPKHGLVFAATSGQAEALRSLGRFVEAEKAAIDADKIYRSYTTFPNPNTLKLISDIRLDNPQRKQKAIETSRNLLTILREDRPRVELGGANSARFDKLTFLDNEFYATILDSFWFAESRSGNPVPLSDEVFDAAQGMLATKASQAFAKSAAAKIASRTSRQNLKLIDALTLADKEWADLENRLQAANIHRAPVSTLQDLRRRKAANEQTISRLVAKLTASAPEYIDLLRPKPFSIKEAQNLLKTDESILLTLPTNHGVHVLVISKQKTDWFRADLGPEELKNAVQRLLWDVGGDVDVSMEKTLKWGEEGEGAYPFDRKSAFNLYEKIIRPVVASLAGKRHVFVAASGSLSALPLGLLVTEKPVGMDGDPADLRSTKWLADAFPIIRVPSVRSLALLRMQQGISTDDSNTIFSGFGDPLLDGEAAQRGVGKAKRLRSGGKAVLASDIYDKSAQTSANSTVRSAALKQLARLPGTAVELKAMQSAFGAPEQSLHLGASASEKEIRQADLSKVDVLAIATHGLLAGEISGAVEPGLVMTPPNGTDTKFDGYLTASEIALMNLSADWVILSACNTAAGDGSDGAAGLSGLARAFFLAGAENLLASHWPIRDDVAPILTVRMIELAKADKNMSRAEALQQAIREVRNESAHDSDDDTWAHPSAWAPFSLIGDAGF